MRRAILVAVAFASLWSQPGNAVDGNELLADCEYFLPEPPTLPLDALKAGHCIGYIQGVWDALLRTRDVCRPDGLTVIQLGDVVKLCLRNHPETRHHTADELVAAALKEKFPCN
jgi:Rap1a immunity proteins